MFRYTLSHATEGVYVLPSDPKGWDQAKFSITRSPKYHGMNYAQVVALSFICGSGKEFIDNVYNTYGIDEEIKISIEECCNPFVRKTSASYSEDYSDDYEKGAKTISCDWEMMFEGVLDLKNIAISYDRGGETTVPIIEQGLNQKFISRADTKIDLFKNETIGGETISDITPPYDLNLHSKALSLVGTFDFADPIEQTVSNTIDNVFKYLAIPLFIESSEGDGFNSPLDSGSIFYNSDNANDLPFLYQNVSAENQTINITSKFTGSIKFKTTELPYAEDVDTLAIVYGTSPAEFFGGTYIELQPSRTIVYAIGETFEYNSDYSGTITLAPGQKIWILIRQYPPLTVSPSNTTTAFEFSFANVKVSISSISIALPSVCKAQYIYETFSKIAESILDIPDPVRSSYYGRIGATPYEEEENGCGSFAAITSGVMIRQYPSSGLTPRGIEVSLNEMFDTADAIDNIGVGFERISGEYKLRIEPKKYFYNDVEILKLDHVPQIKISVAQEYAYNDILIGFEKWQVNSINGLDEYCSKSQYTNGMKSVTQNLEKLSPIIGSAYVLEQIRRKPYNETATTDTDYDNDNFIIALNRSVGYDGSPIGLDVAEKDENFSVVENVISPETTYNLRYTNSKNMLRNMPSVSPIITKYSGRPVKFTYGEGNKFIITKDNIECPSYFNGNQLSGSQDIIWDSCGEYPLFVAEILDFQYPITRSDYFKLKDSFENPLSATHNGYITISNEEETFKGYLLDMQYSQISGLTTFKLLRKYD